jgi:hypothetical protein
VYVFVFTEVSPERGDLSPKRVGGTILRKTFLETVMFVRVNDNEHMHGVNNIK